MKIIYTCLFTFFSLSAFSQLQFSIGYSLSAPQQKMADNIKPLHSIATNMAYRMPGKFSRLQAGIDLGWGVYANTRKEQTFTFDNGSTTKTWVNYSSNVVQANLAGRVYLLEDKQVMPYVSGKAGYTSFYSNIFIEDPHDADGCKALEQQTIIKDGAITGAYGGGVLIDFNLFTTRKEMGRRYIDISVNNIRGGNIDYINTKKLYDANNPPAASGGKPLNVKFINATTQQIHEHQVAEVYNTPIRMLEFKISTVFVLHPDK